MSTSPSTCPPRTCDQYEDNPDFTVVREPSFFNYVGLFNTAKAPLDDPKVRQALSYAIPYDDIITVGAQGYGTQSHGPVPAGVFPYDETVPQYSYDIEKAKAAAEGGRPRGRRLLHGDHLRLREPAGDRLRAAHRGRVRAAGHRRDAHPDAVQPAVGARQGRRRRPPGHVPAALLADLLRRRRGQHVVAVPQQRGAVLQPQLLERPEHTTSSSTTRATKTATDRAAAQAGYSEALNRLVDQAPGVFLYDTQFVAPIPNEIAGYEYNLNYPFAQFFYPLHPAQ